MKNLDIYDIATVFRSAILKAKNENKFNCRDRMHKFPDGCCDDTCDLLAYYLYTTYRIHTRQVVGTYHDEEPYNTTITYG